MKHRRCAANRAPPDFYCLRRNALAPSLRELSWPTAMTEGVPAPAGAHCDFVCGKIEVPTIGGQSPPFLRVAQEYNPSVMLRMTAPFTQGSLRGAHHSKAPSDEGAGAKRLRERCRKYRLSENPYRPRASLLPSRLRRAASRCGSVTSRL